MRLTRFTDNALRCLMYLGQNPDRVVTVGEVSRRMGMSEDHLLKVVRRLVDLGHVRTLRGRSGGLLLNRAPSEIVLGEVVRATEDNLAIVPCFQPGDESCPLRDNCDLADAFEEALGAFFDVLQKRTLADLLGAGRARRGARVDIAVTG
jgi:Rrf2 family nitric oxide-sensitive transcriptional repressor